MNFKFNFKFHLHICTFPTITYFPHCETRVLTICPEFNDIELVLAGSTRKSGN